MIPCQVKEYEEDHNEWFSGRMLKEVMYPKGRNFNASALTGRTHNLNSKTDQSV